MATVLVGPVGTDPSLTQPEKYSSCFWDFVTGWVCQTVEAPTAPPPVYNPSSPEPQPLGNTPDPNANPVMLPVAGVATNAGGCCGRCGGNASVASSPMPAIPVLSGEVTATGKQCGDCKCGYTNREAMLAVVVALAFFVLVRKA